MDSYFDKTEDIFRAAVEEWKTTFDGISIALCFLNEAGRIMRCNPAFERIVEKPFAQFSGQHVDELIQSCPREICLGERWFLQTEDPLQRNGQILGTVRSYSEITDRKEEEAQRDAVYQREHRIAEMLQRSLLLTVPEYEFPGLAIATLYEAAWEESSVGGDFFDTFVLTSGKVAMVVGDVSGKGLAAATHTAEVKYALRALVHEYPVPAEALRHLNNFLCSIPRFDQPEQETMLALSLVILDCHTGQAEVSTAGAEPPLILRADNSVEEIQTIGLPLRVLPGTDYMTQRFELRSGDTILMATDGITEARHDSILLGVHGMAEIARDAIKKSSLFEAGQAILDSARAFAGGKLLDDACLLLAQRR